VVDDYDDTRRFLCALLESSGYRTVEADDGHDAVAVAMGKLPDAIVMDLAMPGVDGLTTLRALRAMPSTAAIPVLVLTGSGSENRRAAYEAGCRAFATKPCPPATLLSLLQSMVNAGGARAPA